MRIDAPAPNVGDIIKMRLADGTEIEGRFNGQLTDLLAGDQSEHRTELTDGITSVRKGFLSYLEGPGVGNLSIGAHMLLMQTAAAGDAAGDYLKGYMAASDNPYAEPESVDLLGYVRTQVVTPEANGETADAELQSGQTLADLFTQLVNERVRLVYDTTLGIGAEYEGTDGADKVQAGARSTLSGGGGDDALAAQEASEIAGGDGNDRIDGYSRLTATGDAGNDIINAYDNANLSGGDGDDRLTSYGASTLRGGAGNDYLSAYNKSVLDGGDGHDYISAGSDATISGGAGNDFISAYDRARIDAGDGRDFIEVYGNAVVDAGAGDDIIRAGANATIAGGQGNDSIRVQGNATIRFGRGDGVDTIEGEFLALPGGKIIETLSSATIELGADVTQGDLTITRIGNELRIAINGTDDAIVLRDIDLRGTPSLKFADGRKLAGADVLARAV